MKARSGTKAVVISYWYATDTRAAAAANSDLAYCKYKDENNRGILLRKDPPDLLLPEIDAI